MRHGVILAGGGGTRLWPASTSVRPKQFLCIGSADESLLAASARRLKSVCDGELFVVCAEEQRSLVQEALPDLAQQNILGEPCPRNTAAAVALAAWEAIRRDPSAVLGILPSDQFIINEEKFADAMALAFDRAQLGGEIVTIGIPPTHPETGFGYLEVGDKLAAGVSEVTSFVEKPSAELAVKYLRLGYLWNAGMFFSTAKRLLGEVTKHLPELAQGLDSLDLDASDLAFSAQLANIYPTLPAISIDHGIMEKTKPVTTVAGDFGWSDVGSWSSLGELRENDSAGNTKAPHLVAHQSRNNVVDSDPGTTIALVGVDDMIVVQRGSVVLVMPKTRAQDVRQIVKALRDQGRDDLL